MRFESFEREAGFAVRAVARAAGLCRALEAARPSAERKTDQSPVTIADFASQAVVARLMLEAFPRDRLVAEEEAHSLDGDRLEQVTEAVRRLQPEATPEAVRGWIDRAGEPAARFWTLDPLDGTKGFLRDGQYAVALALIVEGEVVLGAVACPKLRLRNLGREQGEGTVAVAVRGGGAFAAPLGSEPFVPLCVSPRKAAAEARLLRSFEADHTDVAKLDEIAARLGAQAAPVRMDSQAKSVLLAAGEGDLIFRLLSPRRPDYQEKIWDQAAGAILVQEAGGRVSDLTGAPLDFSAGRTLARNAGVVASNGLLHDAALEAIRLAGADRRPSGQPA